MCRTTFMPSGIRLQQLIQNQYKEILAREKNNDKFIHLYDIGAYWVAFERSTCNITNLTAHQSNRKYGKGDPNEKSQIQTMLQ